MPHLLPYFLVGEEFFLSVAVVSFWARALAQTEHLPFMMLQLPQYLQFLHALHVPCARSPYRRERMSATTPEASEGNESTRTRN